MIILGLDTAQGACSAALVQDGRVLARRFELMRTGHAERLMPQALEVMEEAAFQMGALDRLACTVGPGTFTGTRVALAAARGMAVVLKIPLIGVTTLEAVAAALPARENTVRVAAFDARRGEVYLQVFGGGNLEPLTEPALAPLTGAGEIVRRAANGRAVALAGTGAGLMAEVLAGEGVSADVPPVEGHPDAAVVAQLAAARVVPALPPAPLYLRAPDAKLPDPK